MVPRAVHKEMVAAKVPAQRLCNEIQLFDLCDLETCSFKVGKFCTNAERLAEFEQISDAEVVRQEVFDADELEEGDDACEEEYDDVYEDDEFRDEREYDEE
jgi:hypothetical protein